MASKKEQNQDLGQGEVQAKMDEINEAGFFGTETDPTPNENYTVKGVTSGKPTPETDEETYQEAQAALR